MTALRYADGGLAVHGGGPSPAWPRVGLLGDPVEHSLSPRLHQAALRARGEQAEYRAVRVTADQLAACLTDAHRAGVVGLNVTLPHKEAALALAGQVDPPASRLGAANTLRRGGDGWIAHNTDAPGLLLALRRFAPSGVLEQSCRAAVVGAGGAARAAVGALVETGVGDVRVIARRPERAQWALAWGCEVRGLHAADLEDRTLLIQATPAGLSALDPPPVDAGQLLPEAFVVDLTYGAAPSRLLRAARARGCATLDGLPLLVAQAALSFALWWGGEPPVAVMAEAAGIAWG